MQARAAGQHRCANFVATMRPRTASMVITSRRAASHDAASRFEAARRPLESRDDLALPARAQLAHATARRGMSTAAARPAVPFHKGNLALRDGTPASISSMDVLHSEKDRNDLAKFYSGLSSFSGIKGDRCSDRDAGGSSNVKFHAPRQMEIAQDCLRSGGRVLALRAEVNGESVIVGACMMDYADDGAASPNRMVAADAFRGQGIATMLKLAQLQCAMLDGRTCVRRFFEVDLPVMRTYTRACEDLGLTLTMWPNGGFRIALPAASSAGPAAGPSADTASNSQTA